MNKQVEAIRKKIEKRIDHDEFMADHSSEITQLVRRELDTLYDLLKLIDSFKEEPQPKNSYFETIYYVGTESRWKVGDNLAVYEFYSDYEGEHIYGEIEKVEFDEECEDWKYTFKDDSIAYESELISEQAYKKN